MKTSRNAICLILAISLLSSCAPFAAHSGTVNSSVRAWFDAPLPNTVVVPPNPCQIVAHGASPNGIASFELSINGAISASIPSPDAQSSLVTLTRDCGLTEPGEYLLQLRARDNLGNWSGFAETNMVIAGGVTETPTPAPLPVFTLTPTLTLTPTVTSTATPTGGVSIEEVSTDLVYLGRASCGTLEVTITARAAAPKDIKVVVFFYRFATGNASSEFQSAAMKPIGSDLYQYTLNPTSLLGGVPFDQATLQYQVVIQQDDGDTSIRTPVMADIAVQACGSVTTSCSSYTSQRPCEANGCNWVAKPGIVPVYECRAP